MSAGKECVNGFHLNWKCQQVHSFKATGFLAWLTNVPFLVRWMEEYGGNHGTK
jgi:hypothetical protein